MSTTLDILLHSTSLFLLLQERFAWKADVCLRIPRQELHRMGILYNDDEDIAQDSKSNTVLCDVPVQQSVPMFIIRHGKPKRSRRRSTWHSLPLYLSFSGLSDDADIARLSSTPITTPPIPTIQHRTKIPLMSLKTDIDILQSLPAPPSPSSAFRSGSLHGSHSFDNTTFSISIPTPHSFDINSNTGDWAFIQTPHGGSTSSTPSSEPETWILIDDS